MLIKKKFSVVFLIIASILSLLLFVSCEEGGEEQPIEKLVVNTLPKTDYYLGDAFDVGNAQITVYFENDTKETVNLSLNMISEFNSNKLGQQILTIKYKEATTYIAVNVLEAPVYSIEVNSTAHKTEYIVGEAFDVKNLKLLVTHINGYTSNVDVTSEMVSGFDSSSTGSKQLLISYGGRTCQFSVDVVRRSVMQMQLIAPKKLNFIVGDTIAFDDGKIFVSYNDNTNSYLDLVKLYADGNVSVVIEGEEANVFTKSSATRIVTLFYAGNTFSYAVVVAPLVPTSAGVTTDVPAQIFESATHDFSAGKITITYNNGLVEEVGFYDEKIVVYYNDFDINKLGDYTLDIFADGLGFEYTVSVVPAEAVELVVIPKEDTIYQDEEIDITEWQYQIKLNNGKYNIIPDTGSYFGNVTAEMFKGNLETDINNSKVGKSDYDFSIVTLDGKELTTSVTIEVLSKQIVDAELVEPEKTIYSVGGILDLTGARVRFTYNNNDVSDWLDINADMLVNTKGETLNLEEITSVVSNNVEIFVKYLDERYASEFITKFSIKVVKKATNLQIVSSPKKDYVLGEAFDSSDWEIIIRYSDGSTSTVNDFSGAEWEFVNTEFNTIGDTTISLYYSEDIYVDYVVSVTNEIEEIYINKPFLGFVTEGNKIDFSDKSLTIIRENGDKENVGVTEDMTNFNNAITYNFNSTYEKAYVNVDKLAQEAYREGNWEESYNKYYVFDNGEYVSATENYLENNVYYSYIPAEFVYNWSEYYYNFYTFNTTDGSYVKATSDYEDDKTYYLSTNNIYTLSINYLTKVVDCKYVVISKQVQNLEVSNTKQRYILADTQWDNSALSIEIQFDNGTSLLVGGSNFIINSDAEYAFSNNGMTYYVSIIDENGNVCKFSDVLDKLATSNEEYCAQILKLRLIDAYSNMALYSNEYSIYCFENLINNIVAYAGSVVNDEFVKYDNQKFYVNENKEILTNGFVIDNEGNRQPINDSVYLFITYENGNQVRVNLSEASESTSFALMGYDVGKSGIQTITISYLLSSCSASLEVRANKIDSIVVEPAEITLIEGMNLTASDIDIYVNFVDADNVAIEGNIMVDLSDVKCDYSPNEVYDFILKDSLGYYVEKNINISYGEVYAQPIVAKIRKKTLADVVMKVMPKLVYIEDMSGNTEIDYTNGSILLEYNNGTSKTVLLTDASLVIDDSEFNAKLELTNGAQQSQTIRISYTDENNVTKQTSYNVIIKDRKYITIDFKDLPTNGEYVYQYGTGENAGPQFSVEYYSNFDSIPMTMSKGNGYNGNYSLTYRNVETGLVQSSWPTEVGAYVMIVRYYGDTINNEFLDESANIKIVRKELAIDVTDYSVTFGTIFNGDDVTSMGITWEMKGVSNGVLVDNPYVYLDNQDSVVDKVNFTILDTNNAEIIFRELAVEDVNYFIVDCAIGNYVLIPEVTLKSNNYIISETYVDVNAVFTVLPKEIVLVSDAKTKTYGDLDPSYSFEIYDYQGIGKFLIDNDEISSIDELDANVLQGLDYSIIKAECLPIGNQSGIYYYYDFENPDYSNGIYGDNGLIYLDNATVQYKLSRASSDNENVGQHLILSGDANFALPNYVVNYVENYLTIEKYTLNVGGNNLNRYYGTPELTFEFFLTDNTSMQNGDVFGDYFNEYLYGEALYYNLENNTFYKTINDIYYDNWAVAYKNVKFYTDKQCSISLGDYVEYEGTYYGILPIAVNAGEYYVQIQFDSLSLGNYEVEAHKEESFEYAFKLTIDKVNVLINTESFVVIENNTISDKNDRLLKNYFEVDGINVIGVDLTNITDADYIDNLYKNGVIEIDYIDNQGNEISNYTLSQSEYLDSKYRFVKEEGTNVGKYTVTIDYFDSVNNFNFDLVSQTSIDVIGQVNYGDYFIDKWSSRYSRVTSPETVTVDFSKNAFMFILPTYGDVDYGYENRGALSETYSKKSYETWGIKTYFSVDGTNYNDYTGSGISYEITNDDLFMSSLSYMTVGTYTTVMSYSYFDTNKNYLYLGDTVMLSDVNVAKLLNYVLFGTEDELIYTETFKYEVTRRLLDFALISNTELKFDETNKVANVTITGNEICEDDVIDLKFNVSVQYNAKTDVLSYENVSLREYKYLYRSNGNDLEKNMTQETSSAFRLYNAGDYTIEVVSIGNNNYAINNSISGRMFIDSISIPVFLTDKILDVPTEEDVDGEFNITMPYTGKAINPIDSNWQTAQENEYYSYTSTNCGIAKKYINENGEEIESVLNDAPSNLMVYIADELGNYPINVKKVNGELAGYGLSYLISSDFVDYSVVFVYKNSSDKYVACDEEHEYSLIIEPKKEPIFNFAKRYSNNEYANVKKYDGREASVIYSYLTTTNSDISVDDIVFTFERREVEGSTYIAKYDDNGEIITKYDFIDKDNLTDVGEFLVSAYYSDNYSLYFGDSAAYSVNNSYATYSIVKSEVSLTLIDFNSPKISKQYDGYGLTKFNSNKYTGDFNDISAYMRGNAVVDNYSDIYYLLDLKHYNSTYSTDGIIDAVIDDNTTTYNNGTDYGIGYYWYNLRGAFSYEDNFLTYQEVNENYDNWLSWNYTYKISTDYDVLNGCDGIYQIKQREVYFIVNATEDADGIINKSIDSDNIPSTMDSTYTYRLTYDGFTYTSDDIANSLNNKEEQGIFNYGLYVNLLNQNTGLYYYQNIDKYNEYGDETNLLGALYDYSAQITMTESSSINNKNSTVIGVDTSNAHSANSNFIFKINNISIGIKEKIIDVWLTLENSDYENGSETVYGKALSSDAIKFVFDPVDGQIVADSPDANLQSESGIIEIILNSAAGNFSLLTQDGGNVYSTKNIEYMNKTDDGILTIGGSDLVTIAVGTYHTSGANLGDKARYSINILNTEFIVKKQEINIISLERTYYDQTLSNYRYSLRDTEQSNDTYVNVILSKLSAYIEDSTSIDANVGVYNDCIEIDTASINNEYGNYLVIVDENVYLNVVKVVVKIDIRPNMNVEYGDIVAEPLDNVGDAKPKLEIVYTNLPNVDPIYTEANSLRNDFMSDVMESFAYDEIKNLIATSSSGNFTKSLSDSYILETPTFSNYEIVWGNLTFTVIKKLLDISLYPNAYYYVNGEEKGFSALWSERYDFVYDPNNLQDKLTYDITIEDFEVNGTAYVEDEFDTKIMQIFDVTKDEDGRYVYLKTTYDSIEELLFEILNYIITDTKTDTIESTSAGKRFIRLNNLRSTKFDFVYLTTPIMLYPEIVGVGNVFDESNGDQCLDILYDVEITEGNYNVTDSDIIEDISVLTQLNYIGTTEEEKVQYVDTKITNDYVTSNYLGINYSRKIEIVYLSGGSLSDSVLTVVDGDKVRVKLVLTEIFYADTDVRYVNEISSHEFSLIVKSEASSNEIQDKIYDKNDGKLQNVSGDNLSEFDTQLSETEGTYYYYYYEEDGSTNNQVYEGLFDVLTLRVKAIPLFGATSYSYEIIINENAEGKLVLGFVAGSDSYYYVRMYFNNLYMPNAHEKAKTNVSYFTFEEQTLSAGADLSNAEYYVNMGSGYKVTTDQKAKQNTKYYLRVQSNIAVGTVVPDGNYVAFSENVISEQLVELFDGASHTINVYLDKIGEYVNTKRVVSTKNQVYNDSINISTNTNTISADKKYYLYVIVDNLQYVFSYDVTGYTYVTESTTFTLVENSEVVDNVYLRVLDNTEGDATHAFVEVDVDANNYVANEYYISGYSDYLFLLSSDEFVEGLTYYTKIELNDDGANYEFICKQWDGVDYETNKYLIDGIDLFSSIGKTGISISNVYANISKYSIKNRLIKTATSSSNIANVILWPAVSDSNEFAYVVNALDADDFIDSIGTALKNIAIITISGNDLDDNAYNSSANVTNTNNRIKLQSNIKDAFGKDVSDIEHSGLYLIKCNVIYYYGEDNSDLLFDEPITIRLYATDNGVDNVVLTETDSSGETGESLVISNSSPAVISNTSVSNYKRYFTSELDDHDSATYVFDNVSFAEDGTSVIWFYLRITDKKMIDLNTSINGIMNASGLAIRIVSQNSTVTTTLYAQIYDRTSNDANSLIFYESTTSINWVDNINILKVNFISATNDESKIAVRLYQRDLENANTSLVWESFVKDETFGSVDKITRSNLNTIVYGTPSIMGIGMLNASIRLRDYHINEDRNTDMDLAKLGYSSDYVKAQTSSYANKVSGNSTNHVYMFSDEYDIPRGYNENSIYIRFKLDANDTKNSAFDFYFANTTPYIMNSGIDVDNITGQRGMYIRYLNNNLHLGIYKYNNDLRNRPIIYSGVDLDDDKIHEIVISIDYNNVYTSSDHSSYLQDEALDFANTMVNYYVMSIKLDDEDVMYWPCMFNNSLDGFTFNNGSGSGDPEDGFYRDLYFYTGTSYAGIKANDDNTNIEVYDFIPFNY